MGRTKLIISQFISSKPGRRSTFGKKKSDDGEIDNLSFMSSGSASLDGAISGEAENLFIMWNTISSQMPEENRKLMRKVAPTIAAPLMKRRLF